MSTVNLERLAIRVDRLERELEEMRAIVKNENPESILAEIEPFNQKVAEISLQCFPEPLRFKVSNDYEPKRFSLSSWQSMEVIQRKWPPQASSGTL